VLRMFYQPLALGEAAQCAIDHQGTGEEQGDS